MYKPRLETFNKCNVCNFKKGQVVKVSNKKELFFVKITSIKKDKIIGIVDNKLLNTTYNIGSYIEFKPCQVHSIY